MPRGISYAESQFLRGLTAGNRRMVERLGKLREEEEDERLRAIERSRARAQRMADVAESRQYYEGREEKRLVESRQYYEGREEKLRRETEESKEVASFESAVTSLGSKVKGDLEQYGGDGELLGIYNVVRSAKSRKELEAAETSWLERVAQLSGGVAAEKAASKAKEEEKLAIIARIAAINAPVLYQGQTLLRPEFIAKMYNPAVDELERLKTFRGEAGYIAAGFKSQLEFDEAKRKAKAEVDKLGAVLWGKSDEQRDVERGMEGQRQTRLFVAYLKDNPDKMKRFIGGDFVPDALIRRGIDPEMVRMMLGYGR